MLSGTGRFADAWHPFAGTSARLAGILRDQGFDLEIAGPDQRMADLGNARLVVVNIGAPPAPDPERDAARIDGASVWRIFTSVGSRLMLPALATVLLLQFIGIWNNFLLPFVMLTNNTLYPLTLGLYGMIMPTGGQPNEYSLVVASVFLSIVPLAALFLSLQQFWRIDLISGGLKA